MEINSFLSLFSSEVELKPIVEVSILREEQNDKFPAFNDSENILDDALDHLSDKTYNPRFNGECLLAVEDVELAVGALVEMCNLFSYTDEPIEISERINKNIKLALFSLHDWKDSILDYIQEERKILKKLATTSKENTETAVNLLEALINQENKLNESLQLLARQIEDTSELADIKQFLQKTSLELRKCLNTSFINAPKTRSSHTKLNFGCNEWHALVAKRPKPGLVQRLINNVTNPENWSTCTKKVVFCMFMLMQITPHIKHFATRFPEKKNVNQGQEKINYEDTEAESLDDEPLGNDKCIDFPDAKESLSDDLFQTASCTNWQKHAQEHEEDQYALSMKISQPFQSPDQTLEIFKNQVIYDSKYNHAPIESFCDHILEPGLNTTFLSDLPEEEIENLAINGLLHCVSPGNKESVVNALSEISRTSILNAQTKHNRSLALWNFQPRDLISKTSFEKELFARTRDVKRIIKEFKGSCHSIARNNYILTEPIKIPMHKMAKKILALQRNLGDEYFLFTHGISNHHAEFPYIIAQLDKSLWPGRNASEFHFSRVAPPNQKPIPLTKIMSKMQNCDDHSMRNELIAVDAYPLHSIKGESALYFFELNSNVCWNKQEILQNIAETALFSFVKEGKGTWELIHKFSKISNQQNAGLLQNGRILAYAIPRSLISSSKNFAYLSRPYGRPVNPNHNPAKTLELLQKGQPTILAKPITAIIKDKFPVDTVRIIASHLRPEHGIRSFMITEMPTSYEEEYKQTVAKYGNGVTEFVDGVVELCKERARTENLPECNRLIRDKAEEQSNRL